MQLRDARRVIETLRGQLAETGSHLAWCPLWVQSLPAYPLLVLRASISGWSLCHWLSGPLAFELHCQPPWVSSLQMVDHGAPQPP